MLNNDDAAAADDNDAAATAATDDGSAKILLDEESRLGRFVRTTAELEALPLGAPESRKRRLVAAALHETRIVPKHLQDALTAVRQQQHDDAERQRRTREQVGGCGCGVALLGWC